MRGCSRFKYKICLGSGWCTQQTAVAAALIGEQLTAHVQWNGYSSGTLGQQRLAQP